MKKIVIWITLAVILISINFLILRKEYILNNSMTMFLKLVPIDPRSLMQGDYMILRYEIESKIPKSSLKSEGCLVVTLDHKKIAKFRRLHSGEKLSQAEHLLFYRKRKTLKIGAESFFFQEGDAKLYNKAKYGELKVENSGKSVLVGLRDVTLKKLGKSLK